MTQVTLDSTIYLSVGDGATSDYINLNSSSGVFEVALIDLGKPYDRRYKSEGRTITLGITIKANTATGIWDKLNTALEVKLDQARHAADNPQGGHTGVTLGVQLGSSSTMVYFDVIDGKTVLSREALRSMMLAQGMMLWSNQTQGLILELECEPLGRSDAVTYGPFDITKADGFAAYQAAIPGTAPGIVTYTIEDQTSGEVMNKIVIGHRSQPDLDSGDWDPVVDVAASGDGSDTGSITDAVDSDYAGHASLLFSDNWSEIGEALPATAYADQTGKYDVYARVYDDLTVPKPPLNVRTDLFSSTGAMPEGNYTVVMTTIISGSYESMPSDPITFRLSAPIDYVTIAWDVPLISTPTSYRIYFKRDNQAWKYFTDTASTYTLNTESGATTADPPSEINRYPTTFRGRLSLSSGTTVKTSDEKTPALSNSEYELIKLFSGVTLPPAVLEEGGTVERWRIAIDAHRNDGNTSPSVRVDAIWILPSNSIVEAEYLGLDLATARTWVIGGTRHGNVHGVIRNTSGLAEAGQVSVYGNDRSCGISAGPGDTTWAFMPLVVAGVSNVGAIDLSVSISVIPRWTSLIGTI